MRNLTVKFLPSLLLIGLSHTVFATTTEDIDKFKQSWLAQALKLQREIDVNTPLNKATFLGTHNSYNSMAYQKPLRYLDPNQTLSIYDQLEAGVRSVELDAHWTFDNYFSKDILLCHGKSNHIGCSVFDRKITEGLQEIRRWLKDNPKEIVLLYIERHLNGHEPRLASQLDLILGEFMYKPTQVRSSNDDQHFCVALPTSLTKADILKSNKQLIVVTKGCDGTNPKYEETGKYDQIWNDYVFAGIGNIENAHYTFIDETPDDFIGVPDCGKSDDFSIDPEHHSMWRVYEDRTVYGNVPFPHKKVDEYTMMEMVQCGINWQTMDKLQFNDERLYAAVWSWAQDYPKENGGNCAIYKMNSGFMNVSCDSTYPAVACQNAATNEIQALPATGVFKDAKALCASLGKDWQFAVPVNGAQMAALDESAQTNGVREVMLNYSQDKTMKWTANN